MNRFGASKSSVRNQPPTFTGEAVGLKSSMASTAGESGLVRISLMTTPGVAAAPESLVPGEPSSLPLGRQLVFRPQAEVGRFHPRFAGQTQCRPWWDTNHHYTRSRESAGGHCFRA